jgi:hypothetical protein
MSVKYIGLDAHQATTVAAVVDGRGKLVMESIVETKASTLLEFPHGLRGELHATLEEGTWAAWRGLPHDRIRAKLGAERIATPFS